MGISRREFIKGTAASAIFTSMFSNEASNLLLAQENTAKGWAFESHIPSVCSLCPGGCGIMARIYKKNAIRILGNPMHPVNVGGLCPKGIAGVQVLYNPDRIRYPMRQQKKGSGNWERISWDEATRVVVEKLAATRSKGIPHTLVAFAGQVNGLRRAIIERFIKVYGSPNLIDMSHISKIDPAIYLMQGVKSAGVYDISKSSYILSINSDFLEGGNSPVDMMRHYGIFRGRVNRQRGKMVHVEPRMSITAAKADEWIPIKPGTEGAFALGVAHMIVKERLYDEGFVNTHTIGFEDWKNEKGKECQGFKTMLLKDYSPDVVSGITGIAIEIIIKVARELGRLKPAIVLGSNPLSFNYQGIYTRMAIHSLNALLGSIDTAGGILLPRPLPSYFEEPELDEVAKRGLAMPSVEDEIKKKQTLRFDTSNFIAQKLLSGTPYKPSIIMLFDANPVYNNIFSDDYKHLLAETDFVVSFSSFMDETTQYADIVLPNHTYLERWGDFPTFTNGGIPIVGLQQPVVSPFYDTNDAIDTLLKIAQNLGDNFRKTLPNSSIKDLVVERFRKLFESPRGDVFGLKHEQAWTKLLERSGWKATTYGSFDEFWKAVLKRGGWWDPIYYYGEWNRVFKTGSKKLEFAPSALAGISLLQPTAEKEVQNLPHYEPIPVRPEDGEYPFTLNIYTPLAFYGSMDSNIPWLQNVSGAHINYAWGSWVEINPETAERLKIHNGDKTTVESPRGKITAIAKIFEGAMPEVLNMPFGMGRKAEGRWQKDIGANPLDILDKNIDPITGETIWNATRVKIYKS